jgi:hypothetical protein
MLQLNWIESVFGTKKLQFSKGPELVQRSLFQVGYRKNGSTGGIHVYKLLNSIHYDLTELA